MTVSKKEVEVPIVIGVNLDISECSFPINNDRNSLEATREKVGLKRLAFAMSRNVAAPVDTMGA